MGEDWVDAMTCTSLGGGLFFYFRGVGSGISFKTMGRDLGFDFRGRSGGISFKMSTSLVGGTCLLMIFVVVVAVVVAVGFPLLDLICTFFLLVL